MLAKVTSKSSMIETKAKEDLEEKVDKLLAVAKSGQIGNGKDKRDGSRTPKTTPSNSRQGTPTKRGNEPDIRNSFQDPEVNASGPFKNRQKPIQCFKCKGWGHSKRLCPSHLNYTRDIQVTSLPSQGGDKTASSIQSKYPTIIYKISKVLQKYHNPDPVVRLIGPANERKVHIEGKPFLALIDSGVQLLALPESLVEKLN